MKRRIQAVIFDMDGVLADSEWQYYLRRVDFLRENGVDLPESSLKSIIGLTWEGYVQFILAQGKLDWTVEEYRRRQEAHTRRIGRLHYNECLFPDVPDTLKALKKQGFRLGLASSSSRESVLLMLADCALENTFHCVLTQQDVEKVKPEPEIYLKAAHSLGISPAQCVAVEDSVYGIQSALRAGMIVVAKGSSHYTLDQSAAHYRIGEIGELIPLLARLEEDAPNR